MLLRLTVVAVMGVALLDVVVHHADRGLFVVRSLRVGEAHDDGGNLIRNVKESCRGLGSVLFHVMTEHVDHMAGCRLGVGEARHSKATTTNSPFSIFSAMTTSNRTPKGNGRFRTIFASWKMYVGVCILHAA